MFPKDLIVFIEEPQGRDARLAHAAALAQTWGAHLIATFRAGGVEPVLVIGRPDNDALALAVADSHARLVINHDADRGQLSSLIAGLRALPRAATAALVSPVDMPLVLPETIEGIIDVSRTTDAVIVRPTFHGRHGHPVLFKRAIFEELQQADATKGARQVVHADPSRVLDLDVQDEGVLMDVDTPADYDRLSPRH